MEGTLSVSATKEVVGKASLKGLMSSRRCVVRRRLFSEPPYWFQHSLTFVRTANVLVRRRGIFCGTLCPSSPNPDRLRLLNGATACTHVTYPSLCFAAFYLLARMKTLHLTRSRLCLLVRASRRQSPLLTLRARTPRCVATDSFCSN